MGVMGSGLHILLVEDHEDTSRVMTRLLRTLNHEVRTAATVASAIEMAKSHRFDLVISDLGLPDRSGLDLMRELKAAYGITGIALTGFGMEADIEKSREAGFAAHLTKPIRIETLESIIRDLQHPRLD
jgi:CheY-like chemotaxis protein